MQIDSWIQSLAQTIQALIRQSEGLAIDPETDFSSMKSTDNLSSADPRIYAKTWKLISVQRQHRPLKLIVFLDINVNMRQKLEDAKKAKKGGSEQADLGGPSSPIASIPSSSGWRSERDLLWIVYTIIDEFAGEVLVEIKDWDNQDIGQDRQTEIESYDKKEYESKLESILKYAEKEIQSWNIVVVVSDFLLASNFELRASSFFAARSTQHVASLICLQLTLPIFSSDYHKFYIKEFEMPEYDYWFQL